MSVLELFGYCLWGDFRTMFSGSKVCRKRSHNAHIGICCFSFPFFVVCGGNLLSACFKL